MVTCPYCEAEFQAKEIKTEFTEASGTFARFDHEYIVFCCPKCNKLLGILDS